MPTERWWADLFLNEDGTAQFREVLGDSFNSYLGSGTWWLGADHTLRLTSSDGDEDGEMNGRIEDGRIILEVNGKIIGQEQGEILFTEYGISGISVFQLSRYAVRGAAEGKTAVYHLDLMPKLTKEELVQYLADRQRQNGTYKNPQELLIGLLPKKIIDVLVKKTYEPEKIAEKLKDWQISVKGAYALRQAQICSGGVDPEELTDHLESRLYPGVYFAGEVIDVDGPCGGYNLQWAWSSGAVAGKAAAREGKIL